MFFQNLQSLLDSASQVTLNLVKADQGNITVIVMPTLPKGSTEQALSTPLALTATAEELDAEFASLLSTYIGERKSLAEQAEATATVLKAATSASQKKAADALTPKGAKSETSSNEPVHSTDPEDDEDEEVPGTTVNEKPATAPAPAGAAAAPAAGGLWD